MTKFFDPKFSSRPANGKYRENFEATFGKEAVNIKNVNYGERGNVCCTPCKRRKTKRKRRGKAKTLRGKRT